MHATINAYLQSAAWLVMIASWVYIWTVVRRQDKRAIEDSARAKREHEALVREHDAAKAKSEALRERLYAKMRDMGFDVSVETIQLPEEPEEGN